MGPGRLTSDKEIKPPNRLRQPCLQCGSANATMLSDGPEEVRAQSREYSQTDDLEDETGDHDVDADVL